MVTECTTTSAPHARGRCTRGVAKVLSTATGMPAACAAATRAGTSATSSIGLVGDSIQSRSAVRGEASEATTAAVSAMSTAVTSTPARAARSAANPSVTWYACFGTTSRPPCGTSDIAAAIAAIPEANTSAGWDAPSSSASARSNGTQVSVPARV